MKNFGVLALFLLAAFATSADAVPGCLLPPNNDPIQKCYDAVMAAATSQQKQTMAELCRSSSINKTEGIKCEIQTVYGNQPTKVPAACKNFVNKEGH